MDEQTRNKYSGKLAMIDGDLCLIYIESIDGNPTLRNLVITHDRCYPGLFEDDKLIEGLDGGGDSVVCDLGKLISEVQYELLNSN